MVTLLLNAPAPDEHAAQTQFGGRTLVPADAPITWPCRAAC
jgi:hypothetical protein